MADLVRALGDGTGCLVVLEGAGGDECTARGKPPKLAPVALWRYMLVSLDAMLEARTAWHDPRQS